MNIGNIPFVGPISISGSSAQVRKIHKSFFKDEKDERDKPHFLSINAPKAGVRQVFEHLLDDDEERDFIMKLKSCCADIRRMLSAKGLLIE